MAWSKSQLKKFRATQALKKSVATKEKNAKSSLRAAAKNPKVMNELRDKVLTGQYVGEAQEAQRPAVDLNRLEERAFRRGMFTALQMIVDVLIRELR